MTLRQVSLPNRAQRYNREFGMDKRKEPDGKDAALKSSPDKDERVVIPRGLQLPAQDEIEPAVIEKDGRPVYRINRTPPQALVIHCGDPRFQDAFRQFITSDLGISNYAPVVIGGGVHALGMQSFLPKNFKILWEQIKFFIKQQRLQQVIIINHEDCIWYEKMKGYHPGIDRLLKGKLDMLTAAKVILKDFASVDVRAFWAGLDGDKITFTEVTGDYW